MKILYQVDIQNDFMYPKGKLPIPGAKHIIPKLVELQKHALSYNIPILGSVDRHFSDDIELKTFPPHCMNKTHGQKIIDDIHLQNTIFISDKIAEMGKFERLNYYDMIDLVKQADGGKLIFEKQYTNVFTNPHLAYIIEKMSITDVYMCGVATDICVKEAALSFMKRGITTHIIVDAIKGLGESSNALIDVYQHGAKIIKTTTAKHELE
ncbi:MAG: hypothetical protein DRN27_10220 [Thermoplasmata archaeon]|nr:MAG: hypothetical protein DRN27_10220 [Thermoplasmata archaeon]